MKQVIQSFKSGELAVTDVPPPMLRQRGILIQTVASLVSAGTERSLVEFAEKSLLQKAKARPDLVRQVMDKAQREGAIATLESVRNRLDQPLPLGYSSAGSVVEVGSQATGFVVGDRVACAGGGFASHAELVYVPQTLAVTLPPNVAFEEAAFTTLGAIALHGVHQAEVVVGQHVAVIGLGLLGQLTIQILKAAGCHVFGIDLNPQRAQLARDLAAVAATNPEAARAEGAALTAGRGFDAVIITADTPSNDPVVLAGDLARDRAIVVAVGAVGMEIPRKVYYDKELDFRLSRSYGPGRYDPQYEEKGIDYPYAYVRWTEQRNMQAIVDLLATGSLRVAPLITHRFPIEEATRAYELITGKTNEPFLGVVLTYDSERALPERIDLGAPHGTHPERVIRRGATAAQVSARLGVLGAGTFVNATLLPALRNLPDLELVGIVSGSGLTARSAGERFGFRYCASQAATLLADETINWLVVATRHDLHARQAIDALQAGKDVFVEKPLALDAAELQAVIRAQQATGRRLMVGFNRRFAPLLQELRQFVAGHRAPLVATYRANVGAIPATHWTQDPLVGGGRIVGEAIHFIDALQYLIGAPIGSVYAAPLRANEQSIEDEVVITLTFDDGSVGTVVYAAGGDKAFGKERIEIIGDGKVAVLDDFRSLELVANGRRRARHSRLRPDKGHRGEWQTLVAATRAGADTPIALEELVMAHLAAYAVLTSMRHRTPVDVQAAAFWREVAGA